jgi:hypothetical protein
MAISNRVKRKLSATRNSVAGVQKIDGQYTIPNAYPNRTAIIRSNSILREQGFIIKQDDSIFKTKALARDYLANLNCTVIPLGPAYSMVRSQRSTTKIDNPNIVNPEDNKQQNMQVAAVNNFPNECDPFYELDDQMPDSISDRRKRLKQKNAPDLTITATFIAQLNNEKKEVRLKQFMDSQAAKRSNY